MLLVILACARTIPAALQVEDEDTRVEAPEPALPEARLAWMVGEDPLVRRPRVPDGELDPALAAWREVAQLPAPKPTDWADLETLRRGTAAVPFARGARLAALETALFEPDVAMGWVLPLPVDKPGQEQVRGPLDWMSGQKPETLLGILERQVVLGWLDGPAVPLADAARALAQPTYGRVAATPAGALLLRRAEGARDATAAAAGRAALEEATALAALEAAADRDAEQAALRARRAEVAARLEVSGDPVHALLSEAAARLASDAGDDRSTGGALLAQAALRWRNACPDAPCGGFDRVAAMDAAGRWSPTVVPLVETWKVIAAKDALDRLDVAWEEPSFASALDAEVEVLLGTGGSVDRSVLLYPRAGAPVALALNRAAGGGDLTTREDLLRTLGGRLAKAAEATAPTAPESVREPLLRIARRAR